jgi:hypothetical protein
MRAAMRPPSRVHFRFDGNKVEEVWSTAGSTDLVKIHYSTP